MADSPDGVGEAQQEMEGEAPPQAAGGVEKSPPSAGAGDKLLPNKQEFYWRRQAEKMEKELAALRAEREAELGRLTRDRDEAQAKATEAEWRAQRLRLLAEAGLSAELQALVPEGDPETIAGYVEKLKPIAEKLARPSPRGLTNTNPPNPAASDDARLQRLASEAARGDRRALREYAQLRERVRGKA